MALPRGSQYLARLFLARCILSEEELEVCMQEAEEALEEEFTEQTAEILDQIKAELLTIGFTIEEIMYPCEQGGMIRYYGLRTTVTNDGVSESSTDIEMKFVKLFQRLIDAACEQRGYVALARVTQENNKLNEEHRSRALSKKSIMFLSDEDLGDFLTEMLEQKWLGIFRGVFKEDGAYQMDSSAVFTLGPRAMCDLKQYIHDRGVELSLENCSLCQEMCLLRGVACPKANCGMIIHQQCMTVYGTRQCPSCKTRWKEAPEAIDLFGNGFRVNRRRMEQPEEMDEDDEDIEVGLELDLGGEDEYENGGHEYDGEDVDEDSDDDFGEDE